MSRLITILLCLSMSLLFGCGQPKQDSTSPAASAPAEASDPSAEKLNSAVAIQEPAVQKMDTLSPTTTTASATRPIDGTAESAFHNTLMAFQEGQLEQVLNFLPQSYQSDLEQLVHQFAEQFDDDVWASGIALIGRFGQVMSTKKSMILGMDLVKNSPYAKQLATDLSLIHI